jgi:hypothetical protein
MVRYVTVVLLFAAGICGLSRSMGVAAPVEESVVFIEVGYMENNTFVKVEEGSGFVVHPSGWVVTAKHLAEAQLPPGKIRVFRGAVKSRFNTN